MLKLFFYLLFITASTDGIMIFLPIIRPYIVVALIIALVIFFRLFFLNMKVRKLSLDEFFLIIFLLLLLVLSVFNFVGRTINYLAAYFLVFIFLYILPKRAAENYRLYPALMQANLIGVFFICSISILEFFLFLIFGYNFQSFIIEFRLGDTRGQALESIFNQKFKRSFALSDEPTNLAFYLICLGPIAIFQSFKKYSKSFGFFIFCIVIISLAFTFSSSAALIALSASVCTIFFMVIDQNVSNKPLKIFSILTTISFSVIFYTIYNNDIGFLQKLNNISNSARFDSLIIAMRIFLENPFSGIGLGEISENKMVIVSWYGMLLSETGILPFLILLAFYYSIIIKILSAKFVPGRYIYFFSFNAGVMYLATIAVFFVPALWLSLVIFHSSFSYHLIRR